MRQIELDGKDYLLGFKVVTPDLRSLGLRNNPHILQFVPSEWFMLPDSFLQKGPSDWGGIWIARTLSQARNLSKYMADYHGRDTRLFATAIDEILYENSYRIKTNGVYLFEEVMY
ncbi:MAG: hypothetical protein V1725_03640 [archaeon]